MHRTVNFYKCYELKQMILNDFTVKKGKFIFFLFFILIFTNRLSNYGELCFHHIEMHKINRIIKEDTRNT